jgi:hypothetical protein
MAYSRLNRAPIHNFGEELGFSPRGKHRCGALTDGGPIVSYGSYKAPWHVLVAAGDGDVAIVMLSLERHLM